jgi:ArsR family transcriptional regulator, virulence genes transcriptional regulator
MGNCNIFVDRNGILMEIKNLKPENLEKAARMLKAMAHPVRISIIGCLEPGKRMSVTEIHKQIKIEQSTASHHLGILKDKEVLESKREGKNTYYFLKHEKIVSLLACIGECCQKPG